MQEQQGLSSVGHSFAAQVRAFHAELPAEEQRLLEEILAVAERGIQEEDTQGYAVDMYLKIGGVPGESTGMALRPLKDLVLRSPESDRPR
jgi:hypothetical protein